MNKSISRITELSSALRLPEIDIDALFREKNDVKQVFSHNIIASRKFPP